MMFKITALLLLVLWGPVTQHCDLEAAGLLAAHEAHPTEINCCEPSEPCAHDGCELVENGTYRSSGSLLTAVTPALLACTYFICPQLATPDVRDETVLPVVAAVKPQDWVPTWHFVRRAAPLSRAPSSLA